MPRPPAVAVDAPRGPAAAAPLRVALFGQSGPYAPAALVSLVAAEVDAPWALCLVVEGLRHAAAGPAARLLPAGAFCWPLPAGDSLAPCGRAAGLPVLQTHDVNAPACVAALRRANFDALVCVGFDRLFSPAVLATAPRLALNVHPSALPALRGPAPLFWLLRQGATEAALTVHGLDAAEDHGPIFAQRPFALPPRADGGALLRAAGRQAGQMLGALLTRAARGPLTGRPQAHQLASRAPRPRPEDAFVDPGAWACEPLLNFACGAPFTRSPWLRLGDETFFVRRGLQAHVGRRLPADYVLAGDVLAVRCRDGVVSLQVQR